MPKGVIGQLREEIPALAPVLRGLGGGADSTQAPPASNKSEAFQPAGRFALIAAVSRRAASA
jgi:hypothetical protein